MGLPAGNALGRSPQFQMLDGWVCIKCQGRSPQGLATPVGKAVMAEAIHRKTGPPRHPPSIHSDHPGHLPPHSLPQIGGSHCSHHPGTEGDDAQGWSRGRMGVRSPKQGQHCQRRVGSVRWGEHLGGGGGDRRSRSRSNPYPC